MSELEANIDLLKNITLGRIKKYLLKCSDVSVYGDDPTSCWASAVYMRQLLKCECVVIDDENAYPLTLTKYEDLYNFADGIYFCYVDTNFESHYFTIAINGDALTVFSTYGGYEKYIKKTFDKNEWIKLVIRMQDEKSLDLYKYVFDIKGADNYEFTQQTQGYITFFTYVRL